MTPTPTVTNAIDIHGLAPDRAFRVRLTSRVRRILAPLTTSPVTARIDFHDDNGPKGGVALRCAVTVRVPHQPRIRVEAVAENARRAFDGALAKLERRIERYRERPRDRQRRPKKYYAARRLLTGGGEERSG
jgi:ribosome-associated translation inhibitor RaiA